MCDDESRVQNFLRAPAAAAMFVLADRSGYDADGLADPAIASALLAAATAELTPWNGSEPAADVRGRVLALAQPLRELVTAVVTDPRNAWWTATMDRSAQLMLSDHHEDPMGLAAPAGPATRWEVYAQRPVQGIWTSTELAVPSTERIRSGAHAELARGLGDWSPSFPLHQTRLHVSPTARVYEITSPADWHDLALRYGDPANHPGPDRNLLACGGIDHGLAPTWSAVADDWDGVHLTFAGLLSSLYIPVTTDSITTTLWSLDWECTLWLRSAFTHADSLPSIDERPEAPPIAPIIANERRAARASAVRVSRIC